MSKKHRCTRCGTKKKIKKMIVCESCENYYCKQCVCEEFNGNDYCYECNKIIKIQNVQNSIKQLLIQISLLKDLYPKND